MPPITGPRAKDFSSLVRDEKMLGIAVQAVPCDHSRSLHECGVGTKSEYVEDGKDRRRRVSTTNQGVYWCARRDSNSRPTDSKRVGVKSFLSQVCVFLHMRVRWSTVWTNECRRTDETV